MIIYIKNCLSDYNDSMMNIDHISQYLQYYSNFSTLFSGKIYE